MEFKDIENSPILFSANLSLEKNNIMNAYFVSVQNISQQKNETPIVFQGFFNFIENIIISSIKIKILKFL